MLRIPIEAGIAAGAPAWIEVDLGAIAHNVREFERVLGGSTRLIAVVKSNAYGHGIQRVAQTALAAGAAALAVGNVHEGEELREAGIEAPIFVVGPMAPEDGVAAVVHDLVPSLGNLDVAAAVAANTSRPVAVHVEVDSGMRRGGVPAAGLREFLCALRERPVLQPTGIFTHFAAIEPEALPDIRRQLAAFTDALSSVRDLVAPLRHAANTLATLVCPEAHLDAVRIGGGLYGFDPLHGHGPVHLRPALSLRARIVGMRDADPGDAVGYGGAFVCRRPSRLALLPIGYADGLVRGLWQGAHVLVRGRRAPIVGLVSMSQTIVDVTDVPGVRLGDEVTLLGAQDGVAVTADQRVPPGGSTYEVTSLLRASLPRRYLPAPPRLATRAEQRADLRADPSRGNETQESTHGPRR